MGRRKNAAKHLGIYSAGAIIRQIVGFLMLPIYTRYLAPSDYGIVAMLALLISIFELVLGARFASAIPKFYYEHDDEKERGTVIGTALAITITASGIGALLIAAMSRPLANAFLADIALWHFVALYGITLITVAIENYALVYIRLRDKPFLFMAVSLTKLVVALSLNIWFVVFLEWGVAGVVASTVLSSSGFGLVLGVYTIYQTGGWRISKTLTRRLIRFSWPLWVGSAAAVYVTFANRFMIRYFGDLSEVGLYDLAARFSTLVMILIWQPFNQWWQTERFALLRRDDRGAPVYRSVYALLSAALVVMATGISLFADIVIRVMADPAFHTASLAVPPLAFSVVLKQLALFLNVSFLASERTYLIATLKYGSAAMLTVMYIAMIPALGYLGAAYATVAAAFLMLLITASVAKRTFDISVRLFPAFWFIVIGASVVALDILVLAQTSLWVSAAGKCALGLALFGALWWMLERDSATRDDLKSVRITLLAKLGRH
ncbi:MAG: oligosaccharide flippase family protein [Pseudomonadota bacterium]